MKPERIFLIRHGESQGNIDKSAYSRIPDYAMRLTHKGRMQANARGIEIKKTIQNEGIFFYASSYHRTRETYQEIAKVLGDNVRGYYEDPRLREQEWQGRLESVDYSQEKEREAFGSFYYRFNRGESCADVFDRQSSFLNTMAREFEKDTFPENCAIVGHGMQLRVFLMRWFHMSVEEFELLKNPHNCEMITLLKQNDGKYKLEKPLKKHRKPEHPYQFPITIFNENQI